MLSKLHTHTHADERLRLIVPLRIRCARGRVNSINTAVSISFCMEYQCRDDQAFVCQTLINIAPTFHSSIHPPILSSVHAFGFSNAPTLFHDVTPIHVELQYTNGQFLSYSARIRLPATTTMTSYYFACTISRKPGKLTSMSCCL